MGEAANGDDESEYHKRQSRSTGGTKPGVTVLGCNLNEVDI